MRGNVQLIWGDTSRHRCVEHLSMFIDMLEQRVPYLRGNSHRMVIASLILGRYLELNEKDLFSLKLAAAFHNIGLLGVSDVILTRKEKLTPEQRKILLNNHVGMNGRLVSKAFPDFPEAAEGIWFHHERPDGQGPHGLRGNEIPIIASIVGLMEAVDSMSNGRPWREPLTFSQIKAEIDKFAGSQFPQKLANAFRQIGDQIYHTILRKESGDTELAKLSTTKQKISKPIINSSISQRSAGKAEGDVSSGVQPNQKARSFSSVISQKKAIATLPKIISKEEVIQRIVRDLELKPLASNVRNLMAITQNPYCSTDEVAREIILDQALSIRILKLANSSAYSRGRRVTGLKQAISRIGIQTVRKLVMSLEILSQYEGKISEYMDIRLFWEHSITCGLIGSAINKIYGSESESEEDYFLWGILHDVGRLILIDQIPQQYVEVYKNHYELSCPLEVIEKRQIGLDHCDVLKIAMERWSFPCDFVSPVISHHASCRGITKLAPKYTKASAIIALSDRLAHAMLLGTSGNNTIYPFDDIVEFLKLPAELIEQICTTVPGETSALKVMMLSNDPLDNWSDFAKEVKSKLKSGVVPICVSSEPKIDAYRIFFERISDETEEASPNIGVIYLRDTNELFRLVNRLGEIEQKIGLGKLPVIIIYSSGSFDEGKHSLLKGRRYVVFEAPVCIHSLVEGVNTLLTEESVSCGM